MIAPIFNRYDVEITPKRLELFDKYNKIIQWGRQNPTRFIEDFMKIQLTDHQKWLFLSSWVPSTVVWLCSRATGKCLSLDSVIYRVDEHGNIVPITIAQIKSGDKIFDDKGNPIEVIHLNPVIWDDCYEIVFDDGEKIKCNLVHLWKIYINHFEQSYICETEEIIDLLKQQKEVYVPRYNIETKKSYYKKILSITKLKEKEAMRCITVSGDKGLYLCGEKGTVTHNSFMASIFLMARALLLPNTNAYIMAPSGNQAQETFGKLESIATNNIASLMGVSSVFIDECVRQNASASPFTHDKQSYSVTLFNGSSINTLNSVAKNIVGIRSNFSRKMLTFMVTCSKKYLLNCWKILIDHNKKVL